MLHSAVLKLYEIRAEIASESDQNSMSELLQFKYLHLARSFIYSQTRL
jgi:hypothetical protein